MDNRERESLGSRLGFLFVSAGCAIGLGNVWRFPFITGQYGGAAFVLLYLIFLVGMALPVMIMEFSVGRAARLHPGGAFRALEPKGTPWHLHGYVGVAGNYILMMFYTTVSGWMIAYCWYFVRGYLDGLDTKGVGEYFDATLAEPWTQLFWMAAVIVIGFAVCGAGLRRGVESVTKFMMSGLFILLIILTVRSVTLPGAEAGVAFYLLPSWERMAENGIWSAVYAAMGQAFFTLSVGIGSMAIFGSYTSREQSLTGEGVTVMLLDLAAALMAGMVIFPACFAYNVKPNAGPGLVFVTLPNVFNNMPGGRVWGSLFFLFMAFAAMTTVVAVFENIVAYAIDVLRATRRKAVIVNLVIMLILASPCALGFSVFSSFQPLGPGSGVLDLEDFIVSNNLLPLGSLVFVMFCSTRYGWGWDNFIAEANTGRGMKFPHALKPYFQYVLPIAFVIIFVMGYIEKFG